MNIGEAKVEASLSHLFQRFLGIVGKCQFVRAAEAEPQGCVDLAFVVDDQDARRQQIHGFTCHAGMAAFQRIAAPSQGPGAGAIVESVAVPSGWATGSSTVKVVP